MKIEEESLDVSTVAGVQAALVTAFEGDGALEIDLSHVQRMDACGVQLLAALANWAETSGRPCRLVGAAEAVTTAFETVGLAGMVPSGSTQGD